MEISGPYDAKKVEDKIYKLWEDSGFFNPDNLPESKLSALRSLGEVGQKKRKNLTSLKPRWINKFVTAIAPPNITGELHMGHALELTMQDILVRMKRMQGFKTLWIPGIDHAGIAAQNVVEKQLKKEGLTRHDLGREKFEKRMQEWKEKNGTAILGQFKKLGISVDWSRTRYTRDEQYEKAVVEAFNAYHKKGWIYKGYRVINWCIRCGTGISDLEVNYIPEKGNLYYIKYGPFTLATTRPETKLGDTGLAVHLDDKRYKDYIGKDLKIESVDNSISADKPPKIKKIKIKVVADKAVDREFGTGIIKVTPAHDLTDFEISQRHNLPLVKIIDERGKMNQNAGVRYENLKVAEAREKITKDLEELGLLEKTEDYGHNVGRCDRCNSVIEPLPSDQWFLKTSELAKLAKKAIIKKEVKFHPEKWSEISLRWLENIKDWNISRQLWWGHKIPIEGEEDALDTWFSSALWPFVTLDWPDITSPDYKEYYPTDFITSGRDIIFLWILRMIYSGIYFTGKIPFKDVIIHGTILTKDGKRMSKSLGIGTNPVELIEKYGSDATRFGLIYQSVGDQQDIKFGEEFTLTGKKFANKVWNACRFAILNSVAPEDYPQKINRAYLVNNHDKEIYKAMEKTKKTVNSHISKFEFGQALHVLYDFFWHEFCDKYIEDSKKQRNDKVVGYIVITSLKLLHPFMPFVTEEIWSNKLPGWKGKRLLIVENWPN